MNDKLKIRLSRARVRHEYGDRVLRAARALTPRDPDPVRYGARVNKLAFLIGNKLAGAKSALASEFGTPSQWKKGVKEGVKSLAVDLASPVASAAKSLAQGTRGAIDSFRKGMAEQSKPKPATRVAYSVRHVNPVHVKDHPQYDPNSKAPYYVRRVVSTTRGPQHIADWLFKEHKIGVDPSSIVKASDSDIKKADLANAKRVKFSREFEMNQHTAFLQVIHFARGVKNDDGLDMSVLHEYQSDLPDVGPKPREGHQENLHKVDKSVKRAGKIMLGNMLKNSQYAEKPEEPAKEVVGEAESKVEKPVKPKSITSDDLFTGVSKALKGSRLAYHLRTIINHFDSLADAAGEAVSKVKGGKKPKNKDFEELATNRHVADLARKALRGDHSDDTYKQIGDWLKKKGHDLGKAYNWQRIGDSLHLDEKVKEYIDSALKAHAGDRKLYQKVRNQFSRDFGNHSKKDEFWDNLRTHVNSKLRGRLPSKMLTDEMLDKAIWRLAGREADRQELELGNMRRREPKKIVGPGAGTDVDLHQYLGAVPEAGHAERYKRKEEPLKYDFGVKRQVKNALRFLTDESPLPSPEHIGRAVGVLPSDSEIQKQHQDIEDKNLYGPPEQSRGLLHSGDGGIRERMAARHAFRLMNVPLKGVQGNKLVDYALAGARASFVADPNHPVFHEYTDAARPFSKEVSPPVSSYHRAGAALSKIFADLHMKDPTFRRMISTAKGPQKPIVDPSAETHHDINLEDTVLEEPERPTSGPESGLFPLSVKPAQSGKKLKVRKTPPPKSPKQKTPNSDEKPLRVAPTTKKGREAIERLRSKLGRRFRVKFQKIARDYAKLYSRKANV